MEKLEAVFDHIASRVNVNIKPMGIDVKPILQNAIPGNDISSTMPSTP